MGFDMILCGGDDDDEDAANFFFQDVRYASKIIRK